MRWCINCLVQTCGECLCVQRYCCKKQCNELVLPNAYRNCENKMKDDYKILNKCAVSWEKACYIWQKPVLRSRVFILSGGNDWTVQSKQWKCKQREQAQIPATQVSKTKALQEKLEYEWWRRIWNVLRWFRCYEKLHLIKDLKPSVPLGSILNNSTLCPQTTCISFIWISEQRLVISPSSIYWLILVIIWTIILPVVLYGCEPWSLTLREELGWGCLRTGC